MPVNYLDIHQQLPDFCQRVQVNQNQLSGERSQALERLKQAAATQADARERVLAEGRKNPNLRCAVPGEEPLTTAIAVHEVGFAGTVLAADGSQVIPSRHSQVEFGALNIAAVIMQPGSGQAPAIRTHSTLLQPDELSEGSGPASEAYIALMRDLEERRISATLAAEFPAPVLTLTDGGLELFREPRASAQYDAVLDQYLKVLADLADRGVLYAGYVDKPGSNLVVAMLRVLAGEEEDRASRLIDRSLFVDLLKQPGSRSAIFAIQSQQSARFSGDQALHFFYLNVSRTEQPKIARVEIPAWVAGQPDLVNLLHSVLLQQCAASGTMAFPYLIHRAHEEAVIKYEDAARLEDVIVNALIERGIALGEKSGKQTMKDLSGRKRMTR